MLTDLEVRQVAAVHGSLVNKPNTDQSITVNIHTAPFLVGPGVSLIILTLLTTGPK